ncbi:MAG: rnc [Parachlamydiales bacterium]|nr:rnc [Parachlamydiales bacterium]
MTLYEDLRRTLPQIEEKLGVAFESPDLLMLAFVHRSFVNEHRDQIDQHNERLEFLGDSVLGLCLADYLFRRLPSYPEGPLSQLRSRLVDAVACAKFIQKLQLADYILLGKGEQLSEGRTKGSILADCFEAIIGAMYLDGGLNTVRSFIVFHFEKEIEEAIAEPSRNYKAELQDYSQKKFQKPPFYRVVDESGPDHAKIFHVVVSLNNQDMGAGMAASKKEAEQRAAFEALGKIEAGRHE